MAEAKQKPTKPWHSMWCAERPNFLAWREAEDGWIDILTYNYANWQTLGDMTEFTIMRAVSLASLQAVDYAALEQKAEALAKAMELRFNQEVGQRHCSTCPECKASRADREALRQWRER